MIIYLASPFFTPEQVALVEQIENLLDELGLEVYSPRRDGVLSDMTPEERKASTRRIFNKNVEMIMKSEWVLAVIDGRDVGVVWEIGFAHGTGHKIVTYSDHGYGVNVMIRECVEAHVKGLDRLREFFEAINRGDGIEEFFDFSEDVH